MKAGATLTEAALAGTLAAALAAALLPASRLPAGPAPAGPIAFEDLTKRALPRFDTSSDLKRGRSIATMGGGVATGDYDGDSFPDLFFPGSVDNGKKPEKGPCGALFRNRGDGTFEDVTAKSGIRSCGWAYGGSFVDVDSDGRLDLLVTKLGSMEYWWNRGDGTFEERSGAAALRVPGWGVGLAAGDVDGDGRVDLHVVQYLDTDYAKEQLFPPFQIRAPNQYGGQPALLFVQRDGGRFEERGAAAGVANDGGLGLCSVFFDFDGDGKPDLYVTNDTKSNRLYRGRGDGTFEDVTVPTGAGDRGEKPRAGMGIAIGDPDGDGRPDIAVTNFAGEPTTFYRNVEGQLFDDATEISGIGRASFDLLQWGTDFPDLDDDGRPDFVAVSGHLVPRIISWFAEITKMKGYDTYNRGNRSYKQRPLLMRGNGDGTFVDVTASSGAFGQALLVARGLGVADFDGDGRLDFAVGAVSGGIRLFRNVTAAGGNALEILPATAGDGRTVLGTKVAVTAGGRRQLQEFLLKPTYASGGWTPLHFGLGAATSAEKVEVFPPGATTPAHVFENVAAGRLYTLRAGELRPVRAFRR